MIRIILVAMLVICADGLCDEPKTGSKPDPRPQYERMLKGEDAKKAAELEKRIDKATDADRFADALKLNEELLLLRTKVQGEDHWQTVDARWESEAIRKFEALSADQLKNWRRSCENTRKAAQLDQQGEATKARAIWLAYRKDCETILGVKHPETASSIAHVAFNLESQGQLVEAQAIYQTGLDVKKESLGAKHPKTALSYTNLGRNLSRRGKFVDAQSHFTKALAICLDALGERHKQTTTCYLDVAYNLYALKKYRDAVPLLRKGLELQLALFGERDPETPYVYSYLASALDSLGRYAEAEPLHRQAIELLQGLRSSDQSLLAASYANLARNQFEQGKYTDAHPYFEKTYEIQCKLLGDKHPQTLLNYHMMGVNLDRMGRDVEAERIHRRALELYRDVHGPKNRDTILCIGGMADNLDRLTRHSEAEVLHREALELCRTVLGERDTETMTRLGNLASCLSHQAKFSESEQIFKKVIQTKIDVFGENDPATAVTYGQLAATLDDQGRYDEAERLQRKALQIFRTAYGEKHFEVAACYHNLAGILENRGLPKDAQFVAEKALELIRNEFGDRHAYTAAGYNAVGQCLAAQGKYAEAQRLQQRALDIRRGLFGEMHAATAGSYQNLASNLQEQGQYAEARDLYEAAIAIYIQLHGDKHPSIATAYSNLAADLERTGELSKAAELYGKALEIRLKVLGDRHPDVAMTYVGQALNLSQQNKLSEAEALIEKAVALATAQLGDRHRRTGAYIGELALILDKQGKLAEAEPLFRKELEIDEAVLGDRHPDTTLARVMLATNLHRRGRFNEAREMLTRAAAGYEVARLGFASHGLGRAALGAEVSPYPSLAMTAARLGDPRGAWLAIESDLARGMLDEQPAPGAEAQSPDEQKQYRSLNARLAEIQARIVQLIVDPKQGGANQDELKKLEAERAALDTRLGGLAAGVSKRRVASLGSLQAALPGDAALVVWLDSFGRFDEHWACVVRSSGQPVWERLPGSGPQQEWTAEDSALAGKFRKALADGSVLDTLTHELYDQRVARLEKHLVGIKTLYVVPINEMAGVPIEALTDLYTISYLPSGTFIARSRGQQRPSGNRLLAVGDPAFPPAAKSKPLTQPPSGLLVSQVLPGAAATGARLQAGDVLLTYAGTKLNSLDDLSRAIARHVTEKSVVITAWRDGMENTRNVPSGPLGTLFDRRSAPDAWAARHKATEMLASVRGGSWDELPGTRVEVERLQGLAGDDSLVLTGSLASEQGLDALRRSDRLRDFRYIHFATHGQANNVRAFESTLILAQDRLPKEPLPRVGQPFMNGQLSANEVLEFWKLNAVLVTLSACETALGRKGGGDGMLGFAQAFLLAGSRSVCLSLWKVDDSATALLMDRFYRNLLGKREDGAKPMGKAAALDEAKRWLRNLTFDQAGKRLGVLADGVFRGERPALPEMKQIRKPKEATGEFKPFAHPRYWAAFILIGDPD